MQFSELRGRLTCFGEESSPRQAHRAATLLFGLENSLKVYLGPAEGAQRAALHAKAADAGAAARASVPTHGPGRFGDPWADIAKAQTRPIARSICPTASTRRAAGRDLFGYAATLVRAAEERAKAHRPSACRAIPTARCHCSKSRCSTPSRSIPWLEQLMLELSLTKAREYLGADDPDTKLLLGKDIPEGLPAGWSAHPARRSGVAQGAVERRQGRDRGVERPDDRLCAASSTRASASCSTDYDERYRAGHRGAGEARQGALRGLRRPLYPDATFTLRISYGKVAGWTERGQQVPPHTSRACRARDRRAAVRPAARRSSPTSSASTRTPCFDFVTTNDIIGGNSGSPVIDAQGRR